MISAETDRRLEARPRTGGVLTLVVLILHRMKKKPGKPEVPYGVAIAFGALAILIQRFLNQFA